MTQAEKIMQYLEKYGSITAAEAMKEYGVMRLASRISELKKDGVPILSYMEAVQNRTLLTMELRGDADQLDKKLGTLLWMSRYLLQCELPHCIQCLTGEGMQSFRVDREGDEQQALDDLLKFPAAPADAQPAYMSANWCYHIGGDGNG